MDVTEVVLAAESVGVVEMVDVTEAVVAAEAMVVAEDMEAAAALTFEVTEAVTGDDGSGGGGGREMPQTDVGANTIWS